jgi:MSHA biogenesis protein MshJ
MKAWWSRLATRIDALSARERAFIFVSLLAGFMALADTLWISPVNLAYKRLSQQVAAQTQEVDRLRAQLAATPTPVDANQVLRTEIAALQTQREVGQQAIVQASGQGGMALESVLAEFLRKRPGLTLLSTATLGAVIGDDKAVVPAGLSRRGVELRVSGPYAELVLYLRSLEKALPELRWGTMQLRSEKQPPELSLQVLVLEVQP